MKVKIPFKPRFKEPMLDGTKTWTSRTRRYGHKGDTFDAFGATFEIVEEPEKCTLRDIMYNHWKEEGCKSTTDFFEVWEEIHPRKGFVPSQLVWAHIFGKCGESL